MNVETPTIRRRVLKVPPLKRRFFFEHYTKTGSVVAASLHAVISRHTHLNWRKTNRWFLAACEEALDMAIESLEREARRLASKGVIRLVYRRAKWWWDPVLQRHTPDFLAEGVQTGKVSGHLSRLWTRATRQSRGYPEDNL
jgi:hypothetical protein